MLNEFKTFIARGNVLDLAVGVIIGASFGAIVKSLVEDLIMPVVGAIIGNVDFSNYFIPLSSTVTATSLAAAREQGAVFAYGNFITILINFLIVAWIIFLLIKVVNRAMPKKEEPKPAGPPEDVVLLTEIRDLLKAK
ncbi:MULTISPECIES: large conductance mechanosensitive channel protein MscL [unclassified Rhizobium]|jgi:large conductance mechanosensitive channel|uniref:large conductance mechanosensitive channel protein MscL n=1 Tax=unclassified Rhizobium TaxID=2613769 RepID=UPI0016033CBC|nr:MULTISPECIES: large conductance mechanosensitive channel protein MscL [unclassified Rhizobium]MBB1248882.1 large conductance mechanosensitive channel protein MscL [Rhizobium sp. G21]MCV3766802.1 large conductance mechanosensitive channel protein MscL [Rhizobium sp. TRM95796]